MAHYDIIAIGGGLGSSAFAKAMAERGRRVLVLERERQFKDRVRGEYMSPWGVAEARELGSLQGDENVSLFISEATRAAPVGEFYRAAKPVGPLASFRCGDFWVEHPYKDGVALIGDSAATSDPAFGQGLSITARDARVLRDQLIATEDWDAAGHAYAAEHDRYYAVIHKVNNWFRQVFLEQGPEADARSAKALPLLAKDPTRAPDQLLSGPGLPSDDSVRRKFLGED